MGRYSEGKTPTIMQLKPRHKWMARMVVAHGLSEKELSERTGMVQSHITRIVNSPLFVAERERLESIADSKTTDVRQELEARQERSIEIIDDVMFNSHDKKLQKEVALEILDRTGYGKTAEPQKHLHAHFHQQAQGMSDEDLADAAMNLLEEGKGG